MTTVDTEVERLGLRPPHLLKLDTHGFEREIFIGAEKALATSSLLVVEAYNFELRPGAMRFHELCAFLDSEASSAWTSPTHCIARPMGRSGNLISSLPAQIDRNLLMWHSSDPS